MDNEQLMPAALIVNVGARRGKRLYARALDVLTRRGVTLSAAYPVREAAHLRAVAREAIAAGARTLIIGGGDGTISTVVNECAYREVVVGLLPLGTGNSFAHTLGIPSTLEGAVEVITAGHVATIDLGQVGETYFANVTTIGMSAEIALATRASWKRYFGRLAYLVVGGLVLLTHRPFLCRLSSNDEERIIRTPQVIIANGNYFGNNPLVADGSPEDGKFVVISLEALSRLGQARAWLGFLLNRPLVFSNSRAFTARDVRIDAEPPQPIDVDGERAMLTPVRLTVAPRALKVLAPARLRHR